MIREKLPDLVLLDVMMPGMDGYDVCERIKTDHRSADVPVIFVTALGEVDLKAEAFDAGAVDYITRPYEGLDVLVRVNNQLRIHELHNRLEFEVRERTSELRKTNAALEKEISMRIRTEDELRKSRDQLRELSGHLLNVREAEKAEIAREIHDEFGAVFTSLSFGLSWIKKHLPGKLAKISQRTDELLEQVRQATGVARRIQTELRPTILDDLGLLDAISWQIDQFSDNSNIYCTLELDDALKSIKLPANHNVALFRILQEALTNVARHTKASEVNIIIRVEGGGFIMKIVDNGQGISTDPFSKKGSYGVRGMHERVWAIGGEMEIGPGENGGTIVRVDVPINLSE